MGKVKICAEYALGGYFSEILIISRNLTGANGPQRLVQSSGGLTESECSPIIGSEYMSEEILIMLQICSGRILGANMSDI